MTLWMVSPLVVSAAAGVEMQGLDDGVLDCLRVIDLGFAGGFG